MKHIEGVFANNGTNRITNAIVAMWKWDEFFQGNPDLILKNPTLITQVKEKLKRNRECMHKCVEALFDPMLGALDDARLREMVNPDIGDSARFTDSLSSQDSSKGSSQNSSLSRVTSGASSMERSAFSYGSLESHDSDYSYDPKYSQSSQRSVRSVRSDRSLSPNPVLPTTGMESGGGGSSYKKTRKYRTKHKSNNNRRKRTRKNMKRNMKRNMKIIMNRNRKRTMTNKKSRLNMNTRKIKNIKIQYTK